MELIYKKAELKDIDILTETRIDVLRAANQLLADEDMSEVREKSYTYYERALNSNTHTHTAYLVYDRNTVVGAGGVSFFQVMPTWNNPSGNKAYIMNMYTHPDYRRKGIAFKVLDITAISLEATAMGRPLYEKYGFVKMEHEMKLPENTGAEVKIEDGH